MGYVLFKILGLLTCFIFLMVMLFNKKDNNVAYLQYIFFLFPLMYFKPILEFNVFDITTLLFVCFFYKKKESTSNMSILALYRYLIPALLIILTIGLLRTDQPFVMQNLFGLFKIVCLFIFSKVLIEELFFYPNFFYSIVVYLKNILIISFLFLSVQMIVGVQFSLFVTQNPNIIINNAIRYPSFMSDPQVFSQLLGSLAFVSLISRHQKNTFKYYLNYFLVFSCIIGIFIAGGRAGLMGFLIGYFLIFLYSKWENKISYLLVGALVFLFVIMVHPNLAIFMRSTDLNDTYDFRASIWSNAEEIFRHNFFWGIGLNNYSQYVSAHFPDQAWLIDNEWIPFDHPESGYYKYLTEWGVFGFLIFITFIITPLITSFVSFLKNRDFTLLLLMCSLICFLVGFYSTYSLGDVRIGILLATTLSILMAYSKLFNEKWLFLNKEQYQ